MGCGASAPQHGDFEKQPGLTSVVPDASFGGGNGTGGIPRNPAWESPVPTNSRLSSPKTTFSDDYQGRACDGPPDVDPGNNNVEVYGNLQSGMFDDAVMQRMVSSACFRKFCESRDTGTRLSEADGDEIATAMMKFALDRGCVNYAHWFSPVRGEPIRAMNGMKYDGFIDLEFDSDNPFKPIKGGIFTGERLFYNETDGSSFPNGGMRCTHGAAAFNQWDKSSPPFVWKDTLYLPSAFVAWNGFALDHKTPLLRSHDAIQKQGIRLLRLLGDNESKRFTSYLGWEQEFFVVTTEMYLARPDLRNCGRTLMGALPPRHQQSDMNYFAAMPDRVKAYIEEIQAESLRLGISLTCYHNEVAPAQHEFSPIFSASQIAVDQNQIIFEMAEQIGTKHGLVPLWHEKPFKGINGNGKHNNWSLQTDTGKNVFKASDDPKTQR
jgi:glutamine synthetase